MSDLMGRRYGMRGRIWVVFIGLALGGALLAPSLACIAQLCVTALYVAQMSAICLIRNVNTMRKHGASSVGWFMIALCV